MPDPGLAARAEALAEAVTTLSVAVDGLADRQAHTKQFVRFLAVVVAAILVTLVAVGFLAAGQVRTTRQLQTTSDRLSDVQARTSNQVLCPLYTLFLTFEERSVNAPTLSAEERQQRRDAYVVIHQGYDVLGCH